MSRFLSEADSARVVRTLRNLAGHDTSRWVLTGGLAIELHILRRGGEPLLRPLQDIDFVAECFSAVPSALGAAFFLCHVHPNDLPGKNMFQAVDPETGVRVDVFRACGTELDRALAVTIAGLELRMVSIQDIVARLARLNWDLMERKPVAPKYARDFLRLLEHVGTGEIEPIWREHRKPRCLESFAETVRQLRQAIASRPDLLLSPAYSTDVHEECKRCGRVEAFPLTDRQQILSIRGYC